jgi:WD40 repeat protein
LAAGEKKAAKIYTLQLWDLKTRSPGAKVPFGGGVGLGPLIIFSPDSKRVAVTDYSDLDFYVVPSLEWKARAGRRGLVYAARGEWMGYIGKQGIIRRASVDLLERVLIAGHDFQQLALSPDGRTLASSTFYGGISLWDARDGSRLKDLPGHTLRVPSLAFAVDGKTLVSAGWDGRLGIWDMTGKRASRFLRGHNNAFGCAALSPDGGTIATGGDDSTVRLWNVARREEITVLHGHGDNVNGVDFSRDGRWLVSASDDGTVRFWEAPRIEEIEAAEKAGGRR